MKNYYHQLSRNPTRQTGRQSAKIRDYQPTTTGLDIGKIDGQIERKEGRHTKIQPDR